MIIFKSWFAIAFKLRSNEIEFNKI